MAQRALREQADLGHAVEHHPVRLQPLDLLHDHVDGLAQLQVGGVEHRLVLLRVQGQLRGDQLEDVDAGQVPPVGFGVAHQFVAGLGERDVEAALAPCAPVHQELQRHGGLAGARGAFDKMQARAGVAAGHHIIEPGHAGRHWCAVNEPLRAEGIFRQNLASTPFQQRRHRGAQPGTGAPQAARAADDPSKTGFGSAGCNGRRSTRLAAGVRVSGRAARRSCAACANAGWSRPCAAGRWWRFRSAGAG